MGFIEDCYKYNQAMEEEQKKIANASKKTRKTIKKEEEPKEDSIDMLETESTNDIDKAGEEQVDEEQESEG